MTDIYTALAAIPVMVAGRALAVYTPDTLPSSLQTAHLPCRLLLPATAQAVTLLTLAGRRHAVWEITDLLLWSPVGHGHGSGASAAALNACCAAYADALFAGTPLDTPVTRATVTRVELTTGAFVYPDGGGARFDGVRCRLLVEAIA